jgi:hypothetical protein
MFSLNAYTLLVQRDYCDGLIQTEGAKEEAERIAALIRANINKIENIIVTASSYNVSQNS